MSDRKRVIEVRGLTKEIRGKAIVNNINFYLQEGDVLGFLGPNGAGKSTTIKMILGLVSQTKGEIIINGKRAKEDNENMIPKIGAMVESPSFYNYMSAYKNLELYADLYRLSKDRVDEVLEVVNLTNDSNKKVKNFSMGMKQRLGIARALLNRPSIIILDEPTNGLDPVGVVEIRNIIKEMAKKENISFIISSHILSEMEEMCNRVVIINQGTILSSCYVSEILRENKKLEEYYFNVVGMKYA